MPFSSWADSLTLEKEETDGQALGSDCYSELFSRTSMRRDRKQEAISPLQVFKGQCVFGCDQASFIFRTINI